MKNNNKKIKQNLSGDNEQPSSQKRYLPSIESDYDVHNHDSIRGPIPESTPSISENGYQHMLLDVKRARVESELLRPEPRNRNHPPFGRQHGGHEPSDGKRCHDYGYLADDQRLLAVRKELVEEREEDAGENPQNPHSESPHGQLGIVGGRNRQPDFLYGRKLVFFDFRFAIFLEDFW